MNLCAWSCLPYTKIVIVTNLMFVTNTFISEAVQNPVRGVSSGWTGWTMSRGPEGPRGPNQDDTIGLGIVFYKQYVLNGSWVSSRYVKMTDTRNTLPNDLYQ